METDSTTQNESDTQELHMNIKMECEDVTDNDYATSSTMPNSELASESEVALKTEMTLPIKMAPPEESMTLENFVNQETNGQAYLMSTPPLHEFSSLEMAPEGTPAVADIGLPQVDRTHMPLTHPPMNSPIPTHTDGAVSSDSSVLTKINAPQTKNTLLKQIIDKACLKLAREGEESLFLSVNIEQKLCSFVGTETGRQFLTKRPDVMEHFFQFCQAIYKARGDLVSTETSTTAAEDSESSSSPMKPKKTSNTAHPVTAAQSKDQPIKSSVTAIHSKDQPIKSAATTQLSKGQPIISPVGLPVTRSQTKGGKTASTPTAQTSAQKDSGENFSEAEAGVSRSRRKKPYSLRIGVKRKKFTDYETDFRDYNDGFDVDDDGGDDQQDDEDGTPLHDGEEGNTTIEGSGSVQRKGEDSAPNLQAGKTDRRRRSRKATVEPDRGPIEVTESDFIADELYTSKANRKGFYRCTVCNKTFEWSDAYRYHLKLHPNLKIKANSHKCQLCDRQFMTMRDLQSHCRNMHKALNSFECMNCMRMFTSAFVYSRHTETCGVKFPCANCKCTFPTKVQLQAHVVSCIPGTSYVYDSGVGVVKVKEEIVSDDEQDGGNAGGPSGSNQPSSQSKSRHDSGQSESNQDPNASDKRTDLGKSGGRKAPAKKRKSYIGYKSRSKSKKLGDLNAGNKGSGDLDRAENKRGSSATEGEMEKGRKAGESGGKPFMCHICMSVLQTMDELLKHMETHEEGDNKCPLCDLIFNNRRELNTHKYNIHRDDSEKFMCQECGRKFLQAWTLHRHSLEAHGEQCQLICRKCGRYFNTTEELQDHLTKNISNEECEKCDAKSESLQCEKTEHNKLKKESRKLTECDSSNAVKHEEDSTVKTHSCEQCGIFFINKAALSEHSLRFHTKENSFRYSCAICKKGFKHRGKLKVHMISHKDVRPYQCDTCGMCFKMAATLMCHIRRHQGVTLHKCTYCSKKFRSVEGVRNHMLLHHIKPEDVHKLKYRVYMCEFCGKMMGQKHLYLRHVRLHTGHRPWECEECGKRFTTMSGLNVHKKYHLERKPYNCDVCGLGFVDMTKYNNHLQTSKHGTNMRKAQDLREYLDAMNYEQEQENKSVTKKEVTEYDTGTQAESMPTFVTEEPVESVEGGVEFSEDADSGKKLQSKSPVLKAPSLNNNVDSVSPIFKPGKFLVNSNPDVLGTQIVAVSSTPGIQGNSNISVNSIPALPQNAFIPVSIRPPSLQANQVIPVISTPGILRNPIISDNSRPVLPSIPASYVNNGTLHLPGFSPGIQSPRIIMQGNPPFLMQGTSRFMLQPVQGAVSNAMTSLPNISTVASLPTLSTMGSLPNLSTMASLPNNANIIIAAPPVIAQVLKKGRTVNSSK